MMIQYNASSAPYHHATIATPTCCKDDIPTWRKTPRIKKIKKELNSSPSQYRSALRRHSDGDKDH